MATLTTMDKAAAQQLGRAVAEALKAVAAEYGVTVKAGGGKYDPTAGTYAPRIEFRVEGGAEGEYRSTAPLFGLDADTYGREFSAGIDRRRFRVSGINIKARKRPVLATEVGTDKVYSFDAESVKRFLSVAS